MFDEFVILLHEGHGPRHYDFMLRRGEALACWQCPANPAGLATGDSLDCWKIQDHRLAYLDYEGPVRGSRGEVRQIDRGTYEPVAIEKDRWEFQIVGRTVEGRWELSAAGGDNWQLQRLE